MFSHASDISGAPLALALLSRHLPLFGFHPLLLLPEPGPIEKTLKSWKIEYKILKRANAHLDFIRIVKKEKPVLVHVNSLVKTWPVLVSRFLRRPTVWHVHEYLDNKKVYARLIHFFADGVILISHEQYTLFRGKPKAVLISNGIDHSLFEDVDAAPILSRKGNKVRTVVSYIGRIEPNKGLLILAKAASLLSDHPWINYIVVGSTPKGQEAYREKILKLIEKGGLTGRFHFLGYRSDIPEILAVSDILCHPSYSDTFPLVMMEAMASNLPVIGTDVGEVPWIIDEGKTGFVVPPGDYRALAEAIDRLDADKKICKKMGRAGKMKAKRDYEIKTHTQKVAQFYREVIKKRGC